MSLPLGCLAGCTDGVVLVASCSCMGKCPCEPWEQECPECLATPGYATCMACGEEPAVDLDENLDACCADCLQEGRTPATEPFFSRGRPMNISDTVESCCQDHGLPSRTAASVAERVTDRLAEEAEQGCTVAAAVLRPIDHARLRAELLTAGRVLTEPLRAGLTEAHRLGALDILLQRIACAAGEAAVAEEIATMRRARHERAMNGYRERTAALPDLGGESALEMARRLDGVARRLDGVVG